ncbi:MAG: multicopper oxidase domain-containing protein [Gemmatimonadetes bacterium]|nr:multicopper oxidase domain-containing protein [Gemmatimonadota bacterium]
MPANTATRSRRLKPITIELLIVVLLLGVTCYWLLFIRATNTGLTFENKLLIPKQLFGTVVDGRRQFHLTVAEGSREFLPGKQTPTAGVNGPFLGPTLRLRRGEDVDLIVQNNLDEITTMHWHGMHVPARMDGTPHQKIEPGESWTASFPVDQQAAPLWYHPHPHGSTGRQVYRGVAGLMWIDDDNSDALDLPKTYGVDDIPLVLQDRLFDNDGAFRFARNQGAVFGNTMLINGTWNPFLQVESRRIRFRLLNGSNARIYYIGFDDNREFHQIATDGGFLETPLQTNRVILAPGERAEILVDFSDGAEVVLKSYPEAGFLRTITSFFWGIGTGNLQLLKIVPQPAKRASHALPERLNTISRIDPSLAAKTRPMVLAGPRQGGRGGRGGRLQNIQQRITRNLEALQGGRGQGGRGGRGGRGGPPINGKTMDMARIDEVVRLGDIEIWEVHNRGGQPHPFHLHPVQFQILDRNGQPSTSADLGWKDTVLVPPGDLVRIIMAFERYADPQVPYMYHCHVLEHEDNGMMGQFLVVEEPEQLSLITGKTTVVTFITGVQCGHCYEHARLFDKVLRENDINLVIITPESEPDQERVAALSSSLISDTAGKWAGWFGMAHTSPTHGTVLLDATGEAVWRSTAPEPYMDVQNLVNRAKNLPGR